MTFLIFDLYPNDSKVPANIVWKGPKEGRKGILSRLSRLEFWFKLGIFIASYFITYLLKFTGHEHDRKTKNLKDLSRDLGLDKIYQ